MDFRVSETSTGNDVPTKHGPYRVLFAIAYNGNRAQGPTTEVNKGKQLQPKKGLLAEA